jgi:ribosomal protein S18 acetylase RimI-like enzyme
MIDLKGYQPFEEVRDLLAECMWPDDGRINNEFLHYMNADSRILFGKIINNVLVGLIGFTFLSAYQIELRHIAVKQGYRNQGLGKGMLTDILEERKLIEIVAETDKNAVNFYRRTGFHITSLGEKYPGVERFHCVFRKPDC